MDNFHDMTNVIKELKNTTDDLKNKKMEQNMVLSLKNIKKELMNIKLYTIDENSVIETWIKKITSKNEKKILKFLFKNPHKNLPEVVNIINNNVEMVKYLPIDSLTEIDIKNILKSLKYLHELGYIHGSIQPSHLMKDRNKNIILIDFAKSTKIGEQQIIKPHTTDFMSRNLIEDNKTEILDDIESLGYCIIFYLSKFTLKNSDKNYFINRSRYIKNPIIKKYFLLISTKKVDINEYINLF